MALLDLGKIGFEPKDAYNAQTTYERLDCVRYNNSYWTSKQSNNTGHTPEANSEWWEVQVDGSAVAAAATQAAAAEAAAARANTAAALAEQTDVGQLNATFSAAVAALAARVEGLEAFAENLGSTSATLIDSENGYKVCGQPLMTIAAGAPSTAPLAMGCFYFDTTNRILYVSKSVTGATSDWSAVV